MASVETVLPKAISSANNSVLSQLCVTPLFCFEGIAFLGHDLIGVNGPSRPGFVVLLLVNLYEVLPLVVLLGSERSGHLLQLIELVLVLGLGLAFLSRFGLGSLPVSALFN